MEQRRGPRSAFFAEYDAPSELGHACGHNLIATSVMFASIATRRAMAEFGVAGSIEVFGKSAEARPPMLERGAFDGLDAVYLMHPTSAMTRAGNY